MAKKRNLKNKNVSKKNNAIEKNMSMELLKVFRVLFIVIIVLSGFYLLTVAILGGDSSKDDVAETTIQYDEILAGSSFNMRDEEYLVVYYDFTDTELSNLTSQIYNYTYSGKYRIYMVDMSNGFNKKYSSVEKYDTNPESVKELLIKGPTLIKFVDGKVSKYIEGIDAIVDYLK